MLTNASCTIYKRIRGSDYDMWERVIVPACWWHVQTKSNATTEGLKSADVLTVRIPDVSVNVKKDDIIIRGESYLEINTVNDLKGYDYFKVITANYNSFGCNPHIKVVGV